jgi:hypothetical protein
MHALWTFSFHDNVACTYSGQGKQQCLIQSTQEELSRTQQNVTNAGQMLKQHARADGKRLKLK